MPRSGRWRDGRFWPEIRRRAWQIAERLQAEDFLRSHTENPTPPTRQELREGGYWRRGKLQALREWNEAHRGKRPEKTPTYEEWRATQ